MALGRICVSTLLVMPLIVGHVIPLVNGQLPGFTSITKIWRETSLVAGLYPVIHRGSSDHVGHDQKCSCFNGCVIWTSLSKFALTRTFSGFGH